MAAPEVRFGALCLVLTWVPWTILGLLGADVNAGVGALVFAAAASGPSLAALVMWLLYPAQRRGRTVRLSAVWPVAAVVLGALPAVVSAVVLGGPAAIPPHVAAVAASVGGPLGVVGYTLLAGPLSEEFGWRGFLQPRLRERYGRIRTTVVLAVAWGLWHVPLFLLPGSTALLPEYGDAGAWWQTGVALGIAVVLAVLWRTARPRRSPMASGAGCLQAGFST